MNIKKKSRQRSHLKRQSPVKRNRLFERLEDRRLLAVGPSNLTAGSVLQTYTFALATTVEFTEQVCTISPDCDLFASTETLQRSVVSQTLDHIVGSANEVLRRELSIELELIPDNDLLISTGNAADDGYSESILFLIGRQNTGEIESRLTIGGTPTTNPGQRNDYDLGHVLAVGHDQDVAYPKSVGGDERAEAVTASVLGVTLLDSEVVAATSFVTDMLHEIAHQFGADHTVNGVNQSCRDRFGPNAYEPGSGSTIMGLQGHCGSDDLSAESGDRTYFHAASFDQIRSYVDSEIVEIGTSVATDNNLPVVDAGTDYVIPARTPFALTANGSDSDATDVITYSWEQIDLGNSYQMKSGSPLLQGGVPSSTTTLVNEIDRGPGVALFEVGDSMGIYGNRPDGAFVSGDYQYAIGDTVADLLDSINVVFNTPTTGGATPSLGADGHIYVISNDPDTLSPHLDGFMYGSDSDLPYIWFDTWGDPLPVRDDFDQFGPLFRSYAPTENPVRVFPRLSSLLAAEDPASNRDEHLPTQSREMNFRVTVRDQHDFNGNTVNGIASDDVKIAVIDTGEAFRVNAPNTPVQWDAGTTQTVTWSVAGSNANGIDVHDVDVMLSVDGGLTFPHALGRFSNNGSAQVTLPAIEQSTSQARIKIQAAGNIFFDISDQDFVLRTMQQPGVTISETDGNTYLIEYIAIQVDRYDVALNTVPTDGRDVAVTVSADDQSEISLNGAAGSFASEHTLFFNTTDPQSVFVRAINDDAVEGGHVSVLTHAITETGDSIHYPLTLPINDVTASIRDDDENSGMGVGGLIGVDFEINSAAPPSGWHSATSSSVSLSDLSNESSVATPTDFLSQTTGRAQATPNANSLPSHTTSLAGLDGALNHNPVNGTIAPMQFTWSDLAPHAEFNVYVFGLKSFGGVYNQQVSIQGSGSPVVFNQNLVNNQIMVNGEMGTNARSLDSYGTLVTASSSGEIIISVTPNDGSIGISVAGLAIEEIVPPTRIIAVDTVNLARTEGAGGVNAFSFTVIRAGEISQAATLDFSVFGPDGNPATASDFGGSFPSGQIAFSAGQAVSQAVSFNVQGDTDVEKDEAFRIALYNPSDNARIDANYALGTIINDDFIDMVVSIQASPEFIIEGGEQLVYTFTRNDTEGPLTVAFGVGGSATLGDDFFQSGATTFTSNEGTVSFADGSAVATIIVNAVDDLLEESDESVVLSLRAGVGYERGTVVASGTVLGQRSFDRIGLYQGDLSLFHLKNTFTPGASDQYFAFGPGNDAGWVPLSGDWDGDGVDTIGLFQPSESLFHLKNSFAPGASDQYFAFGPSGDAGWIPLVGDWNGDGVDTIGLYQPDLSLFHLKDSFTPGASDQYFAFGPGGNSGWIPLAGDWDGDGVDTIGLYQPDLSLFHLKDSFTPGSSDQYFAFGPGGAGWIPVVGDWDGDAADSIGLYQGDVSLFHLKDSFTPGASDYYFAFGPGGNAGWIPLIGDWNGPETPSPPPQLNVFIPNPSKIAQPGAEDLEFALPEQVEAQKQSLVDFSSEPAATALWIHREPIDDPVKSVENQLRDAAYEVDLNTLRLLDETFVSW